MWNYSYIIPSLFILIIFLGYYFALPRLPIRMNRAFLFLLAIESVVIVCDIVSSWTDDNYTQFSYDILYFLNGLYYVAFILRSFMFYMYSTTLLRLRPQDYRVHTWIYRTPAIILSLIAATSFITGAFYYVDETGFHWGSLHFLTYAALYFYIFISVFYIIKHRNVFVMEREFRSALGFNFILAVGGAARWFFSYYLLMDTFCLMAIVIIYLAFENPEFFLEEKMGIFNSRALRRYLEEIRGVKSCKLFAFVVHNYHELREIYGANQMDAGMCIIGSYLQETFPEFLTFYYRSGRFVILGNSDTDFTYVHEKLLDRFKRPWRSEDVELYLEAGYAMVDPASAEMSADVMLNTLIRALEKADLSDKTACFVVDERELSENEKDTQVKRVLEKAIDENLVEVFLQPIVSAISGELVGAEALARLRDSDGSLIPLGFFIPIAEKNGRINELGEQVFEKTCEFIRENDLKAMGVSWINVNLSPIQFIRQDLDERFNSIIERYGIDPAMIHLEITEESMIDNAVLQKQIQTMQEKGFKFVLDDYGKGYSNMIRLKRCPFINIKLDMEVVWDYFKEPDEMLPNMIKTFKHMSFGITSEGVENKEMADAMANIGSDYLQGYYFSKPLPMDEFLTKYKAKRA